MPESAKQVKKPASKPAKKSKKPKLDPAIKKYMALFFAAVFFVGFLGGWIAYQIADNNSAVVFSSGTGQEIILEESNIIAEVAKSVSPSVVSIDVTQTTTTNSFFFGQRSFDTQSAGTGIILTSDGLIVTNKHVIPDTATQVTVVLNDGTKFDEVDVIDRDPFNDIAYLQIRGVDDLTPATLGDSSQMRVGDKVIAIGNALGRFDNTVTQGIISGVGRPIVAGNGLDAEKPSESFPN